MARPRELLSLVEIADETGISYATLRNYTLKFGDEIPSEGEGRGTRYPRAAVKVFQRLRKESKPGRKPKNAPAPAAVVQAAPPAPVPVRSQESRPEPRPEAAVIPMPAPAPRQAATDTSGMERELAAIRGFLERIANSLEQLASAPRDAAPAPAPAPAPAAAEAEPGAAAPAAPAPLTLASPAREAEREKTGVPLPSIDLRGSGSPERAGQRRLHSLPKVFGQRGRRPE